MRLSEIKRRLSILDWQNRLPEFERVNGSPHWSNLVAFRKMIESVADVPVLKELVVLIKKTSFFQTTTDHLTGTVESVSDLSNLVADFQRTLYALSRISEAFTPKDCPEAIQIRFPDGSDYGTLVNDQTTLQECLKQVLFTPEIEGAKIEIRSWENGSHWIDLYLGVPLAVAYVGRIAWAAAVIRKKKIEGDLLQEQLRALKIKNDQLGNIADAQKCALNALLDAEARALYEQTLGKKPEPEYLERLKNTITTLSGLIQRGSELHPSLLAPEETKNLFPTADKIDSVISRIPELTRGSVTENREN